MIYRRQLIWIGIGTVVVLLSLSVSPALAQLYRDHLPMSSPEINKYLITSAQAKEYEKVEKTLALIAPLTEAFKTKYRIDVESRLRSALSERDEGKLLRVTQQLIYLDIKDLMNLALERMEDSQDKSVALTKSAYLNYLLISPFIEKTRFKSDQMIKNYFRYAILTLETASSSKGQKNNGKDKANQVETRQAISQAMMKIDAEIVQATLGF